MGCVLPTPAVCLIEWSVYGSLSLCVCGCCAWVMVVGHYRCYCVTFPLTESELDVEFSSLSLDDQVALVPLSEEDTIQSWETLLSDLKELQSLTNELYNVVDNHQEVIDRIENHLEDAELKIQQGKEQLAKVCVCVHVCACVCVCVVCVCVWCVCVCVWCGGDSESYD